MIGDIHIELILMIIFLMVWQGRLLLRHTGYEYGITMLTMEAVRNSGGGRVEGFSGCGKGKRKWRQWYDNWWYIVLVIVTEIAYITCPHSLLPHCMVESTVNRGSSSKRDAKDGIVSHDNRKGMCIPKSLLFQVGNY